MEEGLFFSTKQLKQEQGEKVNVLCLITVGWHGPCPERVGGWWSRAPVSLCAVASWRYCRSSSAGQVPCSSRVLCFETAPESVLGCWSYASVSGLTWAVAGTRGGKHRCEPTNSHCLPKFLVHKCRSRPALRPAAWPRLFRSSSLSLLSVQQFFHLCTSLFWNGKFRANYVLIITLLSIYVFRLLHSGIRLSKLC